MIPKFRAYDSSSYKRMYQPEEVMVGNGDIWIIDEDSETNEWIVNNDLNLMQSTGLRDKNNEEIFEGNILKFNDEWADYGSEGYIEGSIEGINYVEIKREKTCFTFGKTKLPESSLINLTENEHYPFGELLTEASYEFEIIGNVYENPELLEVE